MSAVVLPVADYLLRLHIREYKHGTFLNTSMMYQIQNFLELQSTHGTMVSKYGKQDQLGSIIADKLYRCVLKIPILPC